MMTRPRHNPSRDAPVSRWRRLGEQEIVLPVGRSGCAVSWLGLQALFIFIASLICSCCALSAYGWGVVSSRLDPISIAEWPSPFSRPTATATLTQTIPSLPPFTTMTPLSATPSVTLPVTPSATWTSPSATPGTPTASPAPPASPVPSPSPTPTPSPSPGGGTSHSDVRIVYVEYDPAESEDWEWEFVLIENRGPGDQDMSNWTLSNERGDTYTFPAGFILPVDGSVRVWTKSGRDSEIELYWGREEEAWENTSDTATLKDRDGEAVDWRSWSAP